MIKRTQILYPVLFAALVVFFRGGAAFAQEVEVIETEIDIEKAAQELKNLPGLTHIELKEQEVIRIEHNLKKAIEENQELKKNNNILDLRLKNLRGQRNIEVNRMNTIIAERDAYKQQNEQIFGIKTKLEQDITALKSRLESREKELEEKIKTLQGQMTEGIQDIETMQEENADALVLDSVLADQKKSMEVMEMVDELNHENEEIISGKARIHYNMGNIFFNQSKYKKAVKEYQEALRLTPQDPNIHFNLAFVSGEYLNDYQTARAHYQQYLNLNPDADDAVLVRERIFEAELYLKVQIPDSSLEKNPKYQNNFLEH